jgi:hypothetical protein
MHTSNDFPHDPTRPNKENHLSATINGKPVVFSQVSAVACLRCELEAAGNRAIWKIHAVGKVAHRRTVMGLFIDQSLAPGTYDLVNDEHLAMVYHVTPRQFFQLYHAHDFQSGCVTLLECDAQHKRLRGTFQMSMPRAGLEITDGSFDLLWAEVRPSAASSH